MDKGIESLIADMKAAAESATGGKWVREYGEGWDAICSDDDQLNSGFIVAEFQGPEAQENRIFAQSANPANVLSLISALEQAQQENIRLQQKCGIDPRTHRIIDLEERIAELQSSPNGMMQLSNELAEMKRKCAELPDAFTRIAENLRTQDNRITSHPVFVVFQKEEMVVSEEFDHDRIAWVWECGDGEVEDHTARRLEALHQGCRDTRGYSRYTMKSINRFVTACFTEDGCKDYLRQNGHNLNEPFIYVHSAYRNDEWQLIRNWLMTVGGTVEGAE